MDITGTRNQGAPFGGVARHAEGRIQTLLWNARSSGSWGTERQRGKNECPSHSMNVPHALEVTFSLLPLCASMIACWSERTEPRGTAGRQPSDITPATKPSHPQASSRWVVTHRGMGGSRGNSGTDGLEAREIAGVLSGIWRAAGARESPWHGSH